MDSNLNFDIDTESLLLAPIHNFPCFDSARKSSRQLLDACEESIALSRSSASSTQNAVFEACSPLKPGQGYKDKAKQRLYQFKAEVGRLQQRRRVLKETTELMREQVRAFMAAPLVSRRDLMNLNY